MHVHLAHISPAQSVQSCRAGRPFVLAVALVGARSAAARRAHVRRHCSAVRPVAAPFPFLPALFDNQVEAASTAALLLLLFTQPPLSPASLLPTQPCPARRWHPRRPSLCRISWTAPRRPPRSSGRPPPTRRLARLHLQPPSSRPASLDRASRRAARRPPPPSQPRAARRRPPRSATASATASAPPRPAAAARPARARPRRARMASRPSATSTRRCRRRCRPRAARRVLGRPRRRRAAQRRRALQLHLYLQRSAGAARCTTARTAAPCRRTLGRRRQRPLRSA